MRKFAWLTGLILAAGLALYVLRPGPLDLSACDADCTQRLIVAISRHDHSRLTDPQAFDMIQSLALLGEIDAAFRLIANKDLMLEPDAVPALRRLALTIAAAEDWERLDVLLANVPDELVPLVIVPSVYKLAQYDRVDEAVRLVEEAYRLKPSGVLGFVMNTTFGAEKPTAEILQFWATRRAQGSPAVDTDMSKVLQLTNLRSRLEIGGSVDQNEFQAALTIVETIDHPTCRRHALHELVLSALLRDDFVQAGAIVERARAISLPSILQGRGCTFGSVYDSWALDIAVNGQAESVVQSVDQLVRPDGARRTSFNSLLSVIEKVYLYVPMQNREALLSQAREIGMVSSQSVKDTETSIAVALMSAGDSEAALRLLSFEAFATAEHLRRILQVVRPDVLARWRHNQSRLTEGRVR